MAHCHISLSCELHYDIFADVVSNTTERFFSNNRMWKWYVVEDKILLEHLGISQTLAVNKRDVEELCKEFPDMVAGISFVAALVSTSFYSVR